MSDACSVVRIRRTRVGLLVNLLKLLGLRLGDVKPYRQIVVILDKLLNRTSAIL